MPYEIFLALRYLRMRRGRRVAQVTALAAAVGIACGVAALIVALALANGFRDELQDKILRGTAHLTLMRADGKPFREWREAVAGVRGVEGVVDASATRYDGALLSGGRGVTYTVVRGVDAGSARVLAEIRRTLVAGEVEELFRPAPLVDDESVGDGDDAGEPDRASVQESRNADAGDGQSEKDEPAAQAIIGEELAARTGLTRVGDEGWIVTGEKTPMPPGFAPRARRVRVAGIFRSGLYDYDATWIYLSLAAAGEVAGAAETASVVSIEVTDIYAAGEVAARVRGKFGDAWTTVDWREANRPLFAALELERRTVALIILLIMVVAALNITTTLVLVVVERRADIAILGAMGAGARSIMCIFVVEGAVVGAVGALAGVALGLAACYLGDHFELARLPADVYSLSSVPFRPRAFDVLLPALVALLVSIVATIYPALAASRVRPAEALRYE